MKNPLPLSLCLISFSSLASASAVSDAAAEQNLVAIKNQLTEISAELKLHNIRFDNESQINESKCFWNNKSFTVGAIYEENNSSNHKKISYICRKQNTELYWSPLTSAGDSEKRYNR
ncbi:TPA: hypothetical protein ACOVJB_002459 [Klebsiella oxytoca]